MGGDAQFGTVAAGSAAGHEAFTGEHRPTQPVRQGAHLSGGGVTAGEFQHEQGQQGAVDDESGVALFTPAVRGVVVDAVGVRGQGAEAEEQRRVGAQGKLPRLVRVWVGDSSTPEGCCPALRPER